MIISLYAGILVLIYVSLSFYVIKGRFKNRVSLGDNNLPDMQKRVRIHGNFAEYVPLAVFMIFITEVLMSETWDYVNPVIHILCLMLLIGRLSHVWGIMNVDGSSLWRAGGMILTFLVLIITALYNIGFYLFA
ncbi:MAG: MAPEG family protein [Pseudomonadota bacterium]